MALGLMNIMVAPSGYLPWLPADHVLVTSTQAWLLWLVLGAFVLFSSLPLDKSGVSYLRFVSAVLQGYIVGQLLVFDVTTLPARFGWSVLLGGANACDRINGIADAKRGFQLRPAGFCAGVVVAQWVTEGMTRTDSFVAGMATNEIITIVSLPITAAVMLWVLYVCENPATVCLFGVVFLALCAYFFIGIIPMCITLIIGAIAELFQHKVVEWVAIPVDVCVFMALWNPNAEQVAQAGLMHLVRRAVQIAPRQAGLSIEQGANHPTNRSALLQS